MPGRWSWTDAAIFIVFFVTIRCVFIWLATKAFVMMIPDGDACPMCDDETLAIERVGGWRVLGERFRRSWCIGCGWEGVLQRSDVWLSAERHRKLVNQIEASMAKSRSHSGQLPLNSKKSS
ncbi:hypothetical protein [Gemmatimonas sp.]|uniref:hypothetical protein n=1 Tax=Gemmatimonas sp. TaxID=1962908 RepID=UPI002869FA91|nr:hypothetical protein [Gemmatimonas sp.]